MIIALHILGITFETVLGVWIFSKAFPKRKTWGWKQTVSELFMDGFIWAAIFHNFLNSVKHNYKVFAFIILICGLGWYRCFIRYLKKEGNRTLWKMNTVIKCIEFVAITGILAWNYWLGYISTNMLAVGNIFLPFFLYCYYRSSWFQTYLWQLLYLSNIQIVKAAYMTYVTVGENAKIWQVSKMMHTPGAVILEIGICAFIFLIVKYFDAYNILKKALNDYKGKFGVLAFSEMGLLYFFTDLGYDGLDKTDAGYIFIITIIVLLVFLILIIDMFKKSLELEKKMLDIRNEAIEQQYQELRGAYEKNRCLVHDEKHRMQYIEECLNVDDTEAALMFIRKYRKSEQAMVHCSWTGIPTLDFLINTKKEKMDEKSIDFVLNVQNDEIPINDADFVVLLGNLMDNAMEAVEQCPIGDRKINLKMRTVNDIFILVIENSSNIFPVIKNERFVTSKKNIEVHGWGIESAKHIVKKYGGSIDFAYDQNSFQVKILIDITAAG